MLESWLRDDPKILAALVDAYRKAQKTKDIPQLLAISSHPAWVALAADNRRPRTHEYITTLN